MVNLGVSRRRLHFIPKQSPASDAIPVPGLTPWGRLGRFLASDHFARPAMLRLLRTMAICVFVSLVALYPVVRELGWPQNHEQGAFFIRTEIFAQHLRHGDLFPVWSSSDAYGLGTPLPLFYHKLFYYVSASLVLIGWPLKAAILGSLLAFMAVGFFGMRAALLRLNVSRVVAELGAAAFLLSNYAFTDWLVRGAMAEFCAMMLVPWLLWWALRVVMDRRVGYSIAPIMFLMYLAHSVIAFFGMFVVAGALLTALIQRDGRREIAKRSAVSLALVGSSIAPLVALTARFSGDYDVRQIIPPRLTPRFETHPVREYFYNPSYHWMSDSWWSYTTQLDLALWGSLALVVAARCVAIIRHRDGRSRVARHEVYLAAVLVICLAMQSHTFVAVYDLPYFNFIQFPWRLLTFMTPALIVLIVALARTCTPARVLPAACAVVVVAMFATSPVRVHRDPPLLEVQTYNTDALHANGVGSQLMGIGEYLPVVYQDGKRVPTDEVFQRYQVIAGGGGTRVLQGDCAVHEGPGRFEAAQLRFRIECAGPAVVALPVSFNSFSAVSLAGTTLRYGRIEGDPRMEVRIPGRVSGDLVVKLPTLGRVLRSLVP